MRQTKKHTIYHDAIIDEILYNFDTLEDNSINNICSTVSCSRTKVSGIISNFLNKKIKQNAKETIENTCLN